MKLGFLLLVLSSSLSFADGLTQIIPKVQFPERSVRADQLCLEGDQVRTTQAVSVCDETSDDDGVSVCVRESSRTLSMLQAQGKKECVESRSLGHDASVCTRYSYGPLPLSFVVRTAEVTDDDGVAVYNVVSTEEVQIPNCQK